MSMPRERLLPTTRSSLAVGNRAVPHGGPQWRISLRSMNCPRLVATLAVPAMVSALTIGCATPQTLSPVDQVLADVDAEVDASLSSSEDLSRLRWKAQSLRSDPKAAFAGRELALTDTWLAAATALSVQPDKDEAHYTLLLEAVSTTLGSIQALYAKLDAEASLEAARLSFVRDSAASTSSTSNSDASWDPPKRLNSSTSTEGGEQ